MRRRSNSTPTPAPDEIVYPGPRSAVAHVRKYGTRGAGVTKDLAYDPVMTDVGAESQLVSCDEDRAIETPLLGLGELSSGDGKGWVDPRRVEPTARAHRDRSRPHWLL